MAAERRADQLERELAWSRAATVGELAGAVFEARAAAVVLARAIRAHRDTVRRSCPVGHALDHLEQVWRGRDADWGVAPSVFDSE